VTRCGARTVLGVGETPCNSSCARSLAKVAVGRMCTISLRGTDPEQAREEATRCYKQQTRTRTSPLHYQSRPKDKESSRRYKPDIPCPRLAQALDTTSLLRPFSVLLPPLRARAGRPFLSLSTPYSSAKAASIRPVKHKCTTHAQCSSITHATRSLSE
jgi:hypothetical protein